MIWQLKPRKKSVYEQALLIITTRHAFVFLKKDLRWIWKRCGIFCATCGPLSDLLSAYIAQGFRLSHRQTEFLPFFRNKFQGLFQDSNWFPHDSKFYLKAFHSLDFKINSPYIHCKFIHYWECKFWKLYCSRSANFQYFPGPPVFFLGLSSAREMSNKITELSRFFRTCTNPSNTQNPRNTHAGVLKMSTYSLESLQGTFNP